MAHAPSASLERRLEIVRRRMHDAALDSLVITTLPNILYLSNFTGSSAMLVVTPQEVRFVTDSRYATVVSDQQATPFACPGLVLDVVDASYDETLMTVLAQLDHAARVGFEAADVSVARHRSWRARLPEGRSLGLVESEQFVERLRLRKDVYEQRVLRDAARRLSQVASDAFGEIAAGRTELEVAAAIDDRLRRAGFEKPAFDTIVASGENAALPHARPSERKLGENELVVLDFGGVYDSYCVDLTRTVVVGGASDRARSVYDAVLRAHDRAIAAAGPGVAASAIDAAARDALAQDGMGDAFGHGTGHGLGIEVHEGPRIARQRPGAPELAEPVEPGMVFTIEPGAYFPGWGGVRIEDDVLVTERGVEVLTQVTTRLLELG